MADIAFTISKYGEADWKTDGYNGIAWATDDIESAVEISLLTNRGTWFGDTYSKYVLGSNLYLLEQTAITSDALLILQAQNYATEALQWMVTEKLIQSFTVTATMPTSESLILNVQVLKNKPQAVALNYSYDIPI